MTIHDTIARIKILMDKATPGRWSYDDEEGRVNAYVNYKRIGSPDFNDPCNSEFICCMRNAMPELLAHIQRLEAMAQAARPLLAHINALEAELPLHYHSCDGSCVDDFCAKCRGEEEVKRHIDANAALYDKSLAITETLAKALTTLDGGSNA